MERTAIMTTNMNMKDTTMTMKALIPNQTEERRSSRRQ
jgi:hypothetical protein